MAEPVVINTGPLIALARIDALELVGRLPYEFLCPAEVRAELDAAPSPPPLPPCRPALPTPLLSDV